MNAMSASSSGPAMSVTHDEVVDADELEAEAYDADGGEYGGGGYDAGNNDVEPTSIGTAPERPTETDMGGGGRDDW